MAALPSVPKSISYSLKDCAKDYFDKNLNYSMPCPVYKLDTELTALRAQVYKDLELKYSDAFAKSSLILFNLKNVNDFVKKLHAKANLSAEGDAQRRELNRLSNVAAKERKSRNIQEKAEEEKTRAELMELLNDQATLAEGVLRRARQWESLLYSTEGVSFEGIVLLTDDEKNLMVLKTDIDNIFLQLRGEATVLSSRCLKIVIEMERIMKLLRSHPCVQHLVQFVSVREIVSNVLEPTYVTPPKQHRGTALGSTKWRVGDAPEGRVGGIKVLHLNVRNRATHLDKKAKVFHDLLSTRVVVEEKILSSTTVRGVQRKSLVFSTEEAKKEAQCPTKMSEQSDETLEGSSFFLQHRAINIQQ